MSPNAEKVAYWISEREKIRILHDAKAARPWSTDFIFNTYRFCNVRREDDRVTQWLRKRWRDPHRGSGSMTVAMVLARMINWPPTLEAIGFPLIWNPEHILEIMKFLTAKGHKVWGSAYVITTCGKTMDKAEYVVNHVCNEVVEGKIAPMKGDTLNSFWNRLRQVDGLGAGFLAAQVVADLKHIKDNPLNTAEDWWSWAVPGPGSRRGINRYFERPANAPLTDHEWQRLFVQMVKEVEPKTSIRRIHAQDWQNVMCEWDKYERTRTGEGRPKRQYSPETDYVP